MPVHPRTRHTSPLPDGLVRADHAVIGAEDLCVVIGVRESVW